MPCAPADSLRALVRLQQDEALRALSAQIERRAENLEEVETGEPAEEVVEAPFFVQPMIEATRAYSRVGRAFIVAQRDTLRAFAPREEAH
jgi:hypothetical protein